MMKDTDLTKLLDEGTASDALRALKAGDLTSVQLLEAQLTRIVERNGDLNAVVAFDLDRARTEADAADDAREAGVDMGFLHGLPMTIKDTYETEGMKTTAGAPELANYVPDSDADMTESLRRAGAIIFAKTNVPLYAGDHQTYNDVYGTTNNPYDISRTAGGSSGGAAASVASGFTLSEVGSDIGASIRLPSHFNGVFGLKPTHGVLSLRGHVPGPPGTLAHPALAVAGPIGRSIEDLTRLMHVLTDVGSFGGIPGAVLPDASPKKVEDLRIGLWSDDEEAPVASGVREVVETLGAGLADKGATVIQNAHPDIDSKKLHDTYMHLLMAALGAGFPPQAYDRLKAYAADPNSDPGMDRSPQAAAWATSSHKDWLGADERQAKAIASWDRLFETVDLVVAPAAPTVAFPHNIEARYNERVTSVDGVERPYIDILFWAGIATMPLLPSVVIPAGTVDGMPCGVQLIARRWSDLQLLADAETICSALDIRFVPPTP